MRAVAADPAAVAAREHYERGTKLYDIGKYEDAIKEFEAAYEAKSDPALLYNLAQSHRLAGHSTEALQLYRNYLRYVPRAPNRADIEDRIRILEKTVAEHPGTTATPTPVTATPPTVTAPPTTSGPTPPSTVVTPPQPGQPEYGGTTGPATWPPANDPNYPYQQQPPGGIPSVQYPPPAPPMAEPAGHRTAGIALCAVGGGLFVTGAIFGLVAKNQAKKVEDTATQRGQFDPSVESLGRTSVVVQWVGYALGAAGIITGVILLNSHPPEAASAPRVAAAPMVGPGFGGALMQVAF